MNQLEKLQKTNDSLLEIIRLQADFIASLRAYGNRSENDTLYKSLNFLHHFSSMRDSTHNMVTQNLIIESAIELKADKDLSLNQKNIIDSLYREYYNFLKLSS